MRRIDTREEIVGSCGIGDAPGRPTIEMRELHAQDRCLQRVESAIPADRHVLVPFALAVNAKNTQALGESVVVGRHQTAVAERSEVLGREERERSGGAHAPRPAGRPQARSGVSRTDRLARILDDRDSAASADVALLLKPLKPAPLRALLTRAKAAGLAAE